MFAIACIKWRESELVDRHVGLTSDIWTSAATQGYITVTALMAGSFVPGCYLPEKWENTTHLGKALEAAKEWGVSGLVWDNAANVILGADLTGWPHFGCAAHTLQLSVNAGLAHPTTDKATARKLVGHFKLVLWQQQHFSAAEYQTAPLHPRCVNSTLTVSSNLCSLT